MFNSVSLKYDKRSNSYTFNAFLGYRFKYAIARVGYSIPKQKYLFNNLSLTGFTVHRFFIPDVYFICKSLVAKGSVFGVNLKVLNNVIDIIENDIINVRNVSQKLDFSKIDKVFKYKPLKAQLPAYEEYPRIRAINGSIGMLLEGAVGVGKTYISLTLAEMLDNGITLIIAPLATVYEVWLNSLKGKDCLYNTPQDVYLVGSDKEYKGERFILTHFENMPEVLPLVKEYNLNVPTLIVDEVHYFNNIKSARTRHLMDIVDGIKFKNTIPMSGTPVKSTPKDLLPLIKIINTDFTNSVMKRFNKLYKGRSGLMLEVLKERYSNYTVTLNKSTMDLPELTTLSTKVKLANSKYYTLENISKRVRKFMEVRETELLTEYDNYKKTYLELYNRVKTIVLDTGVLTERAFLDYENNVRIIKDNYNNNNLMAVSDIIRNVNNFEKTHIEPVLEGVDKKSFREAKTVYKYLLLKVQGEALANVVMKARIDCYSELGSRSKELTKYLDSTVHKTVIFSNYINVCDSVKSSCMKLGYAPITVYGDTSKDLTRNVNIFTKDPKVNPLITTYKSLGTGVPLTTANVMVILGLPFRQYLLDQAIGRLWRTGQKNPVTVYVIELDTGDLPNITNRDLDIISFFRDEVARLTGNHEAIVIEKSKSLTEELSLQGIIDSNENYLSKRIRIVFDRIREW